MDRAHVGVATKLTRTKPRDIGALWAQYSVPSILFCDIAFFIYSFSITLLVCQVPAGKRLGGWNNMESVGDQNHWSQSTDSTTE